MIRNIQRNDILVIAGMAFYWPIFRNHYFGVLFTSQSAGGFDGRVTYFVLLILLIVFGVCAALRSRAILRLLKTKRLAIPLISIAASLCALCITVLSGTNGLQTVFDILGIFVFALYVFLITVAWGTSITGSSHSKIMFLLTTSFFVSYLLSLNTWLPFPFDHALPIVGPAVCGLTWYAYPAGAETSKPFARALLRAGLVQTALILILFLLVGSAIRGLLSSGVVSFDPVKQSLARPLMSIALSLMLSVAVYFSSQKERLINMLWVVFVLLFFAGLFITAAFTSAWWQISSDIVVMSRTFLGVFLWMILINIAHAYDQNPVFLFSVFFLLTDSFSGIVTNYLIPVFTKQNAVLSQEYVTVLALVMAFILLLGSFIHMSTLAFKTKSEQTGGIAVAGDEARRVACENISRRCGLTQREIEVLLLISQGHSLKKVAESLFISVSTAQSHVKRLYRKTERHSRQEIIDLVNSEVTEK
jgi:DNA-binding CsgD family transcriptional regulator